MKTNLGERKWRGVKSFAFIALRSTFVNWQVGRMQRRLKSIRRFELMRIIDVV
jgi:hypothetical protein